GLSLASSSLALLLISPSFSLYSYGAHRDLHSFPTRRSSDLMARNPLYLFLIASEQPWTVPDVACFADVVNVFVRYWLQRDEDVRSEEHTSELQSRGHLVCRLLLEKKKQDNKDR